MAKVHSLALAVCSLGTCARSVQFAVRNLQRGRWQRRAQQTPRREALVRRRPRCAPQRAPPRPIRSIFVRPCTCTSCTSLRVGHAQNSARRGQTKNRAVRCARAPTKRPRAGRTNSGPPVRRQKRNAAPSCRKPMAAARCPRCAPGLARSGAPRRRPRICA